MTTILILNAVSSLLAFAGFGGVVLRKRRIERRRADTVLAYVTERR